MDIQAEKLALIQWLAGIDDSTIISRFRALRKASEETVPTTLSSAEWEAVQQGLQSVKEGKVYSQEEVIRMTKEKYPLLFR